MTMTGSEGASVRSRSSPGALRRVMRGLRRVMLVGALLGVVALGAGFLWFTQHVPAEEITLQRKADGIVVVTGGASRIADAMELLAADRGRRLLISGVHPSTTSREIARLMPRYGKLFDRVDLDHSAVNTVGNAFETRRWVQERGFRSLIVVTSGYHMPRTMVELARQMPDIELVSFPVITDKLRAEPWWQNGQTARLLFSEYLKYILAQVRIRIAEAPAPARPIET